MCSPSGSRSISFLERDLAARTVNSRDIISVVVSAMPTSPIHGAPMIDPSALICCWPFPAREGTGTLAFDFGFVAELRPSVRCCARLCPDILTTKKKVSSAIAANRKERQRRKYILLTGEYQEIKVAIYCVLLLPDCVLLLSGGARMLNLITAAAAVNRTFVGFSATQEKRKI